MCVCFQSFSHLPRLVYYNGVFYSHALILKTVFCGRGHCAQLRVEESTSCAYNIKKKKCISYIRVNGAKCCKSDSVCVRESQSGMRLRRVNLKSGVRNVFSDLIESRTNNSRDLWRTRTRVGRYIYIYKCACPKGLICLTVHVNPSASQPALPTGLKREYTPRRIPSGYYVLRTQEGRKNVDKAEKSGWGEKKTRAFFV